MNQYSLKQYLEHDSFEVTSILQENSKNIKEKIDVQIEKLKTHTIFTLECKLTELESEQRLLETQKDFLVYGGLALFTSLQINQILFPAFVIAISMFIYLAVYWFLIKKLFLKIMITKKAIASKV